MTKLTRWVRFGDTFDRRWGQIWFNGRFYRLYSEQRRLGSKLRLTTLTSLDPVWYI